MVDYAIQPNNEMIKFYNWCKALDYEFVWIDHHITAIENIGHYNIAGLRDVKESGCMNTWKYLNQEETTPMILRYINDFDIWNRNSEYSWDKTLFPLIDFFDSLGNDLNNNSGELVQTLKSCFADNNYTNEIIKIGKYINKYIKRQYSKALRRIKEVEWNDYKCLVLNSSFKGSSQFDEYECAKDADILVAWSYDGKYYTYGLYSTKPNIDVGSICQQYLSGGGHKGAGGGYSNKFLFYDL